MELGSDRIDVLAAQGQIGSMLDISTQAARSIRADLEPNRAARGRLPSLAGTASALLTHAAEWGPCTKP